MSLWIKGERYEWWSSLYQRSKIGHTGEYEILSNHSQIIQRSTVLSTNLDSLTRDNLSLKVKASSKEEESLSTVHIHQLLQNCTFKEILPNVIFTGIAYNWAGRINMYNSKHRPFFKRTRRPRDYISFYGPKEAKGKEKRRTSERWRVS